MRENSRRNKEFTGDGIKPELLVAMYEAVGAAQLVVSGKFDEKIKEFLEARRLLEEKLELVQTLEDAHQAADNLTGAAEALRTHARDKAAAVDARELTVSAREMTVGGREQKVKEGEEALAAAWGEQRRAAAAVVADRASHTAASQAKRQELEKRESGVAVREQNVFEAERKIRAKLDLLKAPIT